MHDDVSVHALTMPVEFAGRTMAITPTAVASDDGLVLVDVGPDGGLDRLENALSDAGFELSDVKRVVLTHHDADHAGGLASLAERTDVTVAAHREEAAYVRGDEPPQKGGDDRYRTVQVDEELAGGDEISTRTGPMRVIETPGHTPGHVSLYLPEERLLIAGDALVADGDEPLSGPKPTYTADMDVAVESLVALGRLDVEQTICYHGGYVPLGSERIRAIAGDLDAGSR
ncbi:MBL fold metallo-hydrolase [Halovivax sp.]|uniref:MBL fold metallo-hydrolase n=1 Tax=Halovivax sp. TaxID=1935978 RepID=UPI0025BA0332|nr:MBL fold metallo-hydrolase [Halovivax sp.]